MQVVSYLNSECEAHRLIYSGRSPTTNCDYRAECDDACNQIITLAERIKLERLGAVLQMTTQLRFYQPRLTR